MKGDEPLDRNTVDTLHELAAASGDPAVGRKLVAMFLQDARLRLDELRDAIEAGDAERIAALAHSLAGSSVSYGARVVADRCRELQAQARRGDLMRAVACAAVIEDAFERARRALAAEFLDAETPSS